MTLEELMYKMLEIDPGFIIAEGPSNELIIHTGMVCVGGPDVPLVYLEELETD